MIKYLVLSVIGYYIFTYYISPMLEGTQHSGRNQKQKNTTKTTMMMNMLIMRKLTKTNTRGSIQTQ
ncbi:MAG: hypothetical protein IPP49_09330 [Saprospiraceae bacterium]|nr:hypothetical protein [Saprospiraceae bacterium]